MAISTVKSANVTNISASPKVYLDRKVGEKKVMIDQIAVATTSLDEVGDVILFGPIPANATITSIKIFNDDLDSNGTPLLAANVGLYYAGDNGGVKVLGDVLSATCFGTAITDLRAANVIGAELRFEAADITTMGQKAWEIGGLTAEIRGNLLIGLTISAAAATAAAGDIVIVVEYF